MRVNEYCTIHHYVFSGGFKSLRALLVNSLSPPTYVEHADVELHLRKFLLSRNTFLSIAVVSHKPIVGPTSPKCIQIGGDSCS